MFEKWLLLDITGKILFGDTRMEVLQNGNDLSLKKLDALINTKQLFLSCDWGTSSFRLRLIEVPTLCMLAEVSDNTGIASTYDQWKQQGNDKIQQLAFYQNVIKQNIEKLEQEVRSSLAGVPLVLSGMASSSIGMKELPYKMLPFCLDGSDLLIDTLPVTANFQQHTIMVSGVKSENDVMRGEEIQLVGCAFDEITSEQIFIFPGTHSKHIYTKDGKAQALKTYMTGELFHLLSTKSILAASIDSSGSFDEQNNQQAFEMGVRASIEFNPLHGFFLVRTNQLFQKMSRTENYYYLSGMLIGLELNELANKQHFNLTLVSNRRLQAPYQMALKQLYVAKNLRTVDVEEAIIVGHYKIYLNQNDFVKQ